MTTLRLFIALCSLNLLAATGCGVTAPVGVGASDLAMPDLMACSGQLQLCANGCYDLMSDSMHCGACDKACDATHRCAKGVCALSCPANLSACDTSCVNLMNDNSHCGDCATTCMAGQVCSGGKCALTCQMALKECGGICVNPLTDLANCGDCTKACAAGNVCSNGTCALSCQQGLMSCSGLCVNLASDNANCGACGAACPLGNVCSKGVCALNCQMGLMSCSGTCANLQTDSANCGKCGIICPGGNVCNMGVCVLTCQMGYNNCGNACSNPRTDPLNCGKCGTVCPMGNVCNSGLCALSCQMGLSNCSGACVNFQTDPGNCGACANVCPMGNLCAAGKCVVSCMNNLTNCNGTCANLQTDNANCGMCSMVCANGTMCGGGLCNVSCQALHIPCNGACVDPRFDPANCGGCGKVCAFANATPACSNQVCILGPCNAGYGDCDGVAANGCEVNLNTNAMSCGKCGKACAMGQSCIGGACLAALCPPKAFATNGLPTTLTGSAGASYGSFAFDGSGNLLAVVGQSPQFLYSVNIASDAVTQLIGLRAGSSPWTSVAFNAATNFVYLGSGSNGDVDQYDVKNNVLSNLGNLASSSINAMVLAPATFTAYPNQIIAGTLSNGIIAYDVIKKVATTVVTNAVIGNVSGIAVTSTGTIYASSYGQSKLYKIDATGKATVFATLPGASDGVAVDEGRGRIYVADSSLMKLHSVDMNTAVVTDVAGAYAFDGGYWPSPIAYDCNGTLLVGLNPGSPVKVSFIAVP